MPFVETEKILKLQVEKSLLLGNIATPREFIGNPEIWAILQSSFSHKNNSAKIVSIDEEFFKNQSDLTPLINSQDTDSLSELSSTVIKATNCSLEKRKKQKSFISSTPESKQPKREAGWLKL